MNEQYGIEYYLCVNLNRDVVPLPVEADTTQIPLRMGTERWNPLEYRISARKKKTFPQKHEHDVD